jgi:hypothetical protein
MHHLQRDHRNVELNWLEDLSLGLNYLRLDSGLDGARRFVRALPDDAGVVVGVWSDWLPFRHVADLAQNQRIGLGLQTIIALPSEEGANGALSRLDVQVGVALIAAVAALDVFGFDGVGGVSQHIFYLGAKNKDLSRYCP